MKHSLDLINEIQKAFPDQKTFTTADIVDFVNDSSNPFSKTSWKKVCTSENRVGFGEYAFTPVTPTTQPNPATTVTMVSALAVEPPTTKIAPPLKDPTFVPFGYFKDVVSILKSELFFPVYISGLSGNGKTFMVEQACAKTKRCVVRVQINPETDEDDLIGGFRLIDGQTVFEKGPVIRAMESGNILLLDEIDRATNKIMCLQGVLEGKPVLIKKTGEVIHPAPGFNVIATANTKGQGSSDGRFTAASIIDDAFLERFNVAMDQEFPPAATEKKIVVRHMEKFDCADEEFASNLVSWADIIRKTFYDDAVDEVISTRRLCHIIQTFSIFKDKLKSINLCIARFDDDTKEAFLDLYTKVDSGVDLNESFEQPPYDDDNAPF